MYLQLVLGIALLVLLFWLAVKVAKLILKLILAACFILVLCGGILALIYGAELRDIDAVLRNDGAELVYVETIPVNVRGLPSSFVFIDRAFVQNYLSLEVNGTLLQGPDLTAYLTTVNITERRATLESLRSQLSLELLANPSTEGYALPAQRIFSLLHENLPSLILRFLNFLVLPEQNEDIERR